MIVVDVSVIREWLSRHNNVKNGFVLFFGFLLVYYFFIQGVMQKFSDRVLLENSLIYQIIKIKKIIREEEKRKSLLMKRLQIEKEYIGKNEFKIPSINVSEIYRSCGVVQYSIMDASGSSSGGQGRPILTTISRLRYPQVLCILSNFSRRSEDMEFKRMTLGRDEKDHDLKFVMDVGVF